jgi:hypothetical protein
MAQKKFEKPKVKKEQSSLISSMRLRSKDPRLDSKARPKGCVTSLNLLPLARLSTLRVRENNISHPPLRLRARANVGKRKLSLP